MLTFTDDFEVPSSINYYGTAFFSFPCDNRLSFSSKSGSFLVAQWWHWHLNQVRTGTTK